MEKIPLSSGWRDFFRLTGFFTERRLATPEGIAVIAKVAAAEVIGQGLCRLRLRAGGGGCRCAGLGRRGRLRGSGHEYVSVL